MKCGKSKFFGLLVSLSLTLTPPTYAQFSLLTPRSHDSGLITSVSEISESLISNVWFGGELLSWRRVKAIAKDPVITWGTVRDANGNQVQGEVWLIVSKADTFIYFHLTETPNPERGPTAYGGYTVKIKETMTSQFYSFGSGSAVPVIGNDTDAFLVTTTEVLVNSAFTEGETQHLKLQYRQL